MLVIGKGPAIYKLSFLDEGSHKDARVEPYLKALLQLWNLTQCQELNLGPSDIESSAVPPGLWIPQTSHRNDSHHSKFLFSKNKKTVNV